MIVSNGIYAISLPAKELPPQLKFKRLAAYGL